MKKISFLILFFVILLIFLTQDITKNIKKVDVIVVATDANNTWSPFSHTEEDGHISGFEIDFIKEIAKTINLKVVWKKLNFDEVISGVKNETIDLGISSITITPKREKEMLFSLPYFSTSTRIVINKKEHVITGINNRLKGKKVAVRPGTINESIVKKYKPIIVTFGETDMWKALLEQRVDAIVNDRLILDHFVKMNDKNNELKIVGIPVNTSNYGIIANKKNEKLMKRINQAIEQLKESGKFDELYNKWFLEKMDDHKEHYYIEEDNNNFDDDDA